MNVLTTIKDGDIILKVSGRFGPSKTVNLNSFGGLTYIHLRSPTDMGWKTFSMTLRELECLTQLLNNEEVSKIEESVMMENRNQRREEEEAFKKMEETSTIAPPPLKRRRRLEKIIDLKSDSE